MTHDDSKSQRRPTLLLSRGLVGFSAGFILAMFGLALLGFPLGSDLSVTEMEQRTRALWIAVGVGSAMAILAVVAARVRVSRFWIGFVIALGALSVIPVWPHKGEGLLPLATPYLNVNRFHFELLGVLVAHIAVSAAIAGIWHWLSSKLQNRPVKL